MKTINLKGKEYAPVSARVEQFHKDHADGSITTETTFSDGHVIVKATIRFNIISHHGDVIKVPERAYCMSDTPANTTRTFTGHAYGKVGAEKAFEKLETTAVGRALAFAGYLSGGEIASYDEVKDFFVVDDAIEKALEKLSKATTLDELKTVYTSLSRSLQADNEVIAKKDELKHKLS